MQGIIIHRDYKTKNKTLQQILVIQILKIRKRIFLLKL
jgi:hypothetical protein